MKSKKWIVFDNILIRKRDIDYFEFNEREILCHYHLGISYLTRKEIYHGSEENIQGRIGDIIKFLGVDR